MFVWVVPLSQLSSWEMDYPAWDVHVPEKKNMEGGGGGGGK